MDIFNVVVMYWPEKQALGQNDRIMPPKPAVTSFSSEKDAAHYMKSLSESFAGGKASKIKNCKVYTSINPPADDENGPAGVAGLKVGPFVFYMERTTLLTPFHGLRGDDKEKRNERAGGG